MTKTTTYFSCITLAALARELDLASDAATAARDGLTRSFKARVGVDIKGVRTYGTLAYVAKTGAVAGVQIDDGALVEFQAMFLIKL